MMYGLLERLADGPTHERMQHPRKDGFSQRQDLAVPCSNGEPAHGLQETWKRITGHDDVRLSARSDVHGPGGPA